MDREGGMPSFLYIPVTLSVMFVNHKSLVLFDDNHDVWPINGVYDFTKIYINPISLVSHNRGFGHSPKSHDLGFDNKL